MAIWYCETQGPYAQSEIDHLGGERGRELQEWISSGARFVVCDNYISETAMVTRPDCARFFVDEHGGAVVMVIGGQYLPRPSADCAGLVRRMEPKN